MLFVSSDLEAAWIKINSGCWWWTWRACRTRRAWLSPPLSLRFCLCATQYAQVMLAKIYFQPLSHFLHLIYRISFNRILNMFSYSFCVCRFLLFFCSIYKKGRYSLCYVLSCSILQISGSREGSTAPQSAEGFGAPRSRRHPRGSINWCWR